MHESNTHIALFWIHKNLQDRAVWLWTQIAAHYKDEPWVAGYNPLNEPADPTAHPNAGRLVAYYDRVIDAIRTVDPHHVLFLDGNTYATDFSGFPDDAGTRWPNTAFAIHDYSLYGFPKTPEPYARTPEQVRRMHRSYEKKREWMDQRGLCVWNGEWGPVYARKEYDGDGWEATNERRYNVLKDQLALYDKVGARHCQVLHRRTRAHGRTGPLELVHLAVQGHRLPGHGPRLARHTVHAPAP